MPNFEFECKKCQTVYSDIVPFDKTGKYPKVTCPECKSKSKRKLMSACNYAFGDPVGTDKWTNGGTGHDYRFKHNLPKVLKQRKQAEMASHVGANPYGSDTVAKDMALGEGIHDAETRKGLS